MAEIGRPSDYKNITLEEARKIKGSCIYFIKDINNNIVYIGKTKNIKKRFECYKYKKCHNLLLNEWLRSNIPYFDILICEIDKLNYYEKIYIDKYKNLNIFNKIAGGEYPWIKDDNMPWSAGHIKCPSDLLIRGLINRKVFTDKIVLIKNLIKNMTKKDRCLFELSLAKEYYDTFYKNKIEKWLSITENKIINCVGV